MINLNVIKISYKQKSEVDLFNPKVLLGGGGGGGEGGMLANTPPPSDYAPGFSIDNECYSWSYILHTVRESLNGINS